MSANAHIAKRAQESSIDALVDKFSTVLDTSLILAIANEPGQSHGEAGKILEELAKAVPPESVPAAQRLGFDPSSTEFTLLFLQQSFPDVPSERLETALATSDGDLDAVMDEFLVERMLLWESTSCQDDSTRSHSGHRGGLNFDALAEGLSSKRSGKSKKNKTTKRTTGPVTVSLTDQRSPHHLYYNSRTSHSEKAFTSAAPESIDTTGLTDEEIARKLQNAERDAADAASVPVADQQWLLVSSSLSQLAVLLGVPQPRIQSLFHQSSFNLHVTFGRAIEAALLNPAAQRVAQTLDFQITSSELASITGHSEYDVRRLLQATQGNQDAVLDLLQLQSVIQQAADGTSCRTDILDPSGRILYEKSNAERSVMAQSEHKKVTGPAPRWLPSDTSSYAGRATQTPSATSALAPAGSVAAAVTLPASASRVEAPAASASADDATGYTNEECRELASEYRMRRNEALQKAAQSVRQSRGSGIGGAAMVYAEDARKYDIEARRWQLRASCALVEQRRLAADVNTATRGTIKEGGSDRIDLHGLTVHEALMAVSHNIARWQSTPLGEAKVRAPLEIVTGRGMHSRHNVSVLRPAIVRYLTQRGFKVDATSDAGVLYVKAL